LGEKNGDWGLILLDITIATSMKIHVF